MKKRTVEKIWNRIKGNINYPMAWLFTWFRPLKANKYFCMSMSGTSYGDNIKCLSDYIYTHDNNAEIIWAFTSDFINEAHCPHHSVKLYSTAYYYHLLTSKFILSNARLNPRMIHKRKGQFYLQTWHGTTLKRLGYDIKRKRKWWKRWLLPSVFDFDMKNIDIMISGSTYMTGIFRDKFHFEKTIHEIGTPRNDIFFGPHKDIKEKVSEAFGLKDENIVLYAPTFRNDGQFTYYDIDYKKLLKVLEEKTGKSYVFITRLHPILQYKKHELQKLFGKEVIDASSYPDMQELLYATDVLVTDYSSSMFDFMLSQKPVILYTPDKETYRNGFYFDIDQLPFIHVNNNSEIEQAIDRFDKTSYRNGIIAFLGQIGSKETGEASQKTFQILQEPLR